MIKLNKIYTRTGDTGTTGLVRGPRRAKHDLRIEAYGTVEEANAFVGMARLHTTNMARMEMTLRRIQNDLFDVGSDLATPGSDEGQEHPALRVTQRQIDWLEEQIDMNNDKLEPLTSFVLPAGAPVAAGLHAARTVVRRAERCAAALRETEHDTGPLPLAYLNRLSDLLFVLARVANENGKADILWEPGRFSGSKKG